MASPLRLALFVAALYAVASATIDDAPSGKRVLALLDDLKIKWTHSLFFKSLEDRGYQVSYHVASDQTVRLKKYGEWNYDNLIVFAPSSSDFAGVTPASILEFIDSGHNVIVAADGDLGGPTRDIASECNVEFDEDSTQVIDHFNYDASDFHGEHTVIVADKLIDVPAFFGGKTLDAPVLFKGIAQDIEEDSALLYNILAASPTAYSAFPEEPVPSDVFVAGSKIALVSALQARNNARVVFSGSLSLFSDKFFTAPVQRYSADGSSQKFEKSGNELFAKLITQWAFQERGILRVKSVSHHKVGETEAPRFYTLGEEVEYSIEVEEWNGRRWVPFVTDDLQVEFRRIDPFVRVTFPQGKDGNYTARFSIPDVNGVYTFKVEYVKPGYGFLESLIRPIAVRPLRHNQYERFIPSAFPYYASSFSMLAGIFVFSFVFLYYRD